MRLFYVTEVVPCYTRWGQPIFSYRISALPVNEVVQFGVGAFALPPYTLRLRIPGHQEREMVDCLLIVSTESCLLLWRELQENGGK